MEQQIRFCTTSDGVTIAYATAGEGPPLVYVTGWPIHLELEWEKPFARAFLEELAQGLTLVRYDMRGSGLSDRQVAGFSLEELIRDLEAVVDHLGLERFALLSLGLLAGPVAISYAAAHPDRVTHLILSGAFSRGGEIITPERQRALIDYVENFGFPAFQFIDPGLADPEKQRDAREIERAATSPAMQAALLRTFFSVDVSGLLDRVRAPSLVLHARLDPAIPFALGRRLAAAIPNAEFLPFEKTAGVPWAEGDFLIPEVRRFLGVRTKPRETYAFPAISLQTILFTDMEGSTTLTQQLGDAAAHELLRAHNAIVREALRAYGGSEIKHTGDGIMAAFPSASGAIECAVAIQRACHEHAEEHPDAPIRVRVGLNAGEPVAEERDLFGTAVQLAARICGQAQPGQVLIANVVRELAAGKGFLFSDQGDVALRGFEDPVRLFEVRWQPAAQS